MPDPAPSGSEAAFQTMLEIEKLAAEKKAMAAGRLVDQFQHDFWKKLEERGVVERIYETGLGDEIKITANDNRLGFRTSAGTEIWLEQPLGKTMVIDGVSVNGTRNVDLTFVRYERDAAGNVTRVDITGMDNYSTSPSTGGSGHFERKRQVMDGIGQRFRDKFPGADVRVRFDEHESFYWRDKLQQLDQLREEAAAAKGNPAKLRQVEARTQQATREMADHTLEMAGRNARETSVSLAKSLLKAVETSATLAGIAWKGKELTDIEMKLYLSPTLRGLMKAIKDRDEPRIQHFRRILIEWNRPDVQAIVMDFVKLGFGTVMGLELWEKFVDFLIAQWRKAAAEARAAIAAQPAPEAGGDAPVTAPPSPPPAAPVVPTPLPPHPVPAVPDWAKLRRDLKALRDAMTETERRLAEIEDYLRWLRATSAKTPGLGFEESIASQEQERQRLLALLAEWRARIAELQQQLGETETPPAPAPSTGHGMSAAAGEQTRKDIRRVRDRIRHFFQLLREAGADETAYRQRLQEEIDKLRRELERLRKYALDLGEDTGEAGDIPLEGPPPVPNAPAPAAPSGGDEEYEWVYVPPHDEISPNGVFIYYAGGWKFQKKKKANPPPAPVVPPGSGTSLSPPASGPADGSGDGDYEWVFEPAHDELSPHGVFIYYGPRWRLRKKARPAPPPSDPPPTPPAGAASAGNEELEEEWVFEPAHDELSPHGVFIYYGPRWVLRKRPKKAANGSGKDAAGGKNAPKSVQIPAKAKVVKNKAPAKKA